MLSRLSSRASNSVITSLVRSNLQKKWPLKKNYCRIFSSLTNSNPYPNTSSQIDIKDNKTVKLPGEETTPDSHVFKNKYEELLFQSVNDGDYDVFSRTLTQMNPSDFESKRKPRQFLSPLLTTDFIKSCDRSAAQIIFRLSCFGFRRESDIKNIQIMINLVNRHNELTHSTVPPKDPMFPDQYTITNAHHVTVIRGLAKGGFQVEDLAHWDVDAKILTWLSKCLKEDMNGDHMAQFLFRMQQIGFQWNKLPMALRRDIIAGFYANTKRAGAMSASEAGDIMNGIAQLGCLPHELKDNGELDTFMTLAEKAVKLSCVDPDPEANKTIVRVMGVLSTWKTPFQLLSPGFQEVIRTELLERRLTTLNAYQVSDVILSIGELRLYFKQISPRGQNNIFTMCQTHIPNMNLPEFSRTLRGLSLSLFKMSGVSHGFRAAVCSRLETLFGTRDMDVERLYHLDYSERTRIAPRILDECEIKSYNYSIETAVRRQHQAEQRHIGTLILAIGTLLTDLEKLHDTTRIAIFNAIAKASPFHNSSFSIVLRGLAKTNFKWQQMRDSAKQIILKNLYNPKCFNDNDLSPLASTLQSLADLDFPWYLAPKETWLHYVEINQNQLTIRTARRLIVGLGKLACKWQALPVPFLFVMDRLIRESADELEEHDIAELMEGLSLMAFDLDIVKAKQFRQVRNLIGEEEVDVEIHFAKPPRVSTWTEDCEVRTYNHDVNEHLKLSLGNGINSDLVRQLMENNNLHTRLYDHEDYNFDEQMELLMSISDELVRVYVAKVANKSSRDMDQESLFRQQTESEEQCDFQSQTRKDQEVRDLLRKYNYSSRMEYISELANAESVRSATENGKSVKLATVAMKMTDLEKFAIFFEVLNSFEGGKEILAKHFQDLDGSVPQLNIASDHIYEDNMRIMSLIPPLEDRLWLDSTKYRTEFNYFGLKNRILPVDCAIFHDKQLVALVHETKLPARFKKFRSIGASRELKLKEHIYAASHPNVHYYRLGSQQLNMISINSAVQRLSKVILNQVKDELTDKKPRYRGIGTLHSDALIEQVHRGKEQIEYEIAQRLKKQQYRKAFEEKAQLRRDEYAEVEEAYRRRDKRDGQQVRPTEPGSKPSREW